MAGLLYLIFIATCALSIHIQSSFVVDGNAAETARNIVASEWLFRIGFLGELVSAVFFFLSAWALYVLLEPANKSFALLFLLLNLGGVATECINMLNQFAALLLLNGADYLKVFQADQLQALAMLFLKLHSNGFMIAQIFYGTWLFPLGYLVFKSGFLPRVLGILLIIDFPFPGLQHNKLPMSRRKFYRGIFF